MIKKINYFKRQIEIRFLYFENVEINLLIIFIYYTLNYTLPDINGVLNNLNISGNF